MTLMIMHSLSSSLQLKKSRLTSQLTLTLSLLILMPMLVTQDGLHHPFTQISRIQSHTCLNHEPCIMQGQIKVKFQIIMIRVT